MTNLDSRPCAKQTCVLLQFVEVKDSSQNTFTSTRQIHGTVLTGKVSFASRGTGVFCSWTNEAPDRSSFARVRPSISPARSVARSSKFSKMKSHSSWESEPAAFGSSCYFFTCASDKRCIEMFMVKINETKQRS